MGTPNREVQEYSRNIIEYKNPGSYIPIVFPVWGSHSNPFSLGYVGLMVETGSQ